jgi:hypothetical protein
MQQTNKRPGAGGTARGASLLLPGGSSAKRRAKATAGQAAATFAAWCQTPAPHALGLDPVNVGRVVRMMSAPEMRALNTITSLDRNLKLRRASFLLDDALAFERLVLTARCMWFAFRGKVPAAETTAADETATGAAQTGSSASTSTVADAIIARARGGRIP